jgi:hypothetical protein
MKIYSKLLITFTIVLIGTVTTQAQPKSDAEKIDQLRTAIERMVENAPPRDNPDQGGHRQLLASLRSQLRDLLLEKRGGLKSRIENLDRPDALPEVKTYVQQLDRELQSTNDEVQGLEKAIAQASSGGPLRQISVPSQPEPPVEDPAKIEERTKFEEAVNKFSSKDLKAAAAPPEVAESKDVVGCNAAGRPATTTKYSRYDEAICRLASDMVKGKRTINLSRDLSQVFTILTAKLLKTKADTESYAGFVTEAQEIRTDQQMGAGPGSSGTTSLVSKGGIPYLFGLAVENGAATQSQSDTTVTFRVNPAGVFNLFSDKGFITAHRQNERDPLMKFLEKTSLGFSFDTSRGAQPGVFTGDKQQLSAFSARVELFNERDPRQKKYEADWERFVADEEVKLAQAAWKTTVATAQFANQGRAMSFRDPALQAWLNQANSALQNLIGPGVVADETTINAVANAVRAQADLVPVKIVSTETIDALTTFAKQDKDYTDAKDKLLDKIAKGKILTFDYTNTRGVNAPDLSNFNFIAATGTGKRIDLTANGSFTFFNKLPLAMPAAPKPGRIRDFQFAGQVTIPFKLGDAGQFDFWFSGRYERLMENASTPAGTTMPNTKGDIAVGQFGLNIPIKSLGIKFPVSVTFANRTELIKEKEVRGNIGFTFNWDTLFSKLKPF